MKKKQANMYSLPPILSNPPYLSAQELSQFQSQFTLFDSELDLRKLKQSFTNINASLTLNQNYKPVELFINLACAKKQRCSFNQYLNLMIEHFGRQEQSQLIMEMLSDNRKDIGQKVIKQILEQAMGREVTQKELGDIMVKIFEIQDKKQSISKRQIISLLQYSDNKN